MKIKRFLYYLIQWTWGFPQNFVGFILRLIHKNDYRSEEVQGKIIDDTDEREMRFYRGALVTRWKKPDSMSMGMFLFLGYGAGPRYLKHEYGHSIQSLILGPFYLLAIGIPSFLWCNVPRCGMKWRDGRVSYFSVWHERWADRCGFSHDKDIDKQMQA